MKSRSADDCCGKDLIGIQRRIIMIAKSVINYTVLAVWVNRPQRSNYMG